MPSPWSGPLLLVALVLPDMLPPGHHAVDHRIVVTPGGVPAGKRLVAAPTQGIHRANEVVTGEPFALGEYGAKLYLVPAAEPLPEFGYDLFARYPKSGILPYIASVPLGSPLHRVVTTWRIIAVADDSLAVERVAEVYFDAAGNPLPAMGEWILIAAIGLFGAAWLIRLERQRTTPVSAAPPATDLTC